jgi:release factor glutamine methyltransferase
MQTAPMHPANAPPADDISALQGLRIAQARRVLADAFRRADIDAPDLDARLLVGHALGLDHTALAAAADRALDPKEAHVLAAFARRRLACEPVARIIGSKEFWGLSLKITPATLVPRPETETVVEAALAALDDSGARSRPLRIADLGTGSGAILLALLTELPNAHGIGTDISLPALATARENAARLGVSARTAFVACDFGSALAGNFDLVVANPPYIATGELAGLMPEVRYDPPRALDGGTDALTAYRAIAAQAPRLIVSNGHLVLELGLGQAESVAKLLHLAGLAPASPRIDLSAIPRALTASVATMPR